MTIIGCSTQKNTPTTRWWHSFNARYNTYYNGSLAYIDASLEKENGNKDNFTELLPLYTVGNKSSRELGKGNYDRAIEKCQKVIKLHSIKKRPEWNKSRKKTAKDIEWLNRREYNPFLWKARTSARDSPLLYLSRWLNRSSRVRPRPSLATAKWQEPFSKL